MLASNRVLNAILDHMLQLLPDEPADSKRLDDISDAASAASADPEEPVTSDAVISDAVISDAVLPDSEVQASVLRGAGVAPKLRAAS